MPETFTSLEHPHDPAYQIKRQKMINELLPMSVQQLNMQLKYQSQQKPPRDENGEMAKRLVGELLTAPYLPDTIKTGILDSTSGTSGNVLIR